MNFTLMLDTGNAAFGDDEVGELAWVLRAVACKLERGQRDFAVFDSNGNRIGRCEFEPAQEE